MRRWIMALSAGTLALGVFVFLAIPRAPASAASTLGEPGEPSLVTSNEEWLLLLGSLGLTPGAASGTDLSVSEVGSILVALREGGPESREWLAAVNHLSDSRMNLERQLNLARSNAQDESTRTETETARRTMLAAEARFVAADSALVGVIDQTVRRPVALKLRELADLVSRGVPIELARLGMSTSEVARTVLAVKAERRSLRTGEPLDSRVRQYLDALQGDSRLGRTREQIADRVELFKVVFADHGIR